MATYVKLKVSVHCAARTLVPTTFVRLEPVWVNQNTCAQLLERMLRENGHGLTADKLDECEVVLKCYRIIGVHNSFSSKRSRVAEEIIATTFYKDLLGDALREIDSDELLFNISLPAPARPTTVVDATAILMRRSRSATNFPSRKVFPNLTGDQNMYNEILTYLEGQGLGWVPEHLPSATEFLKHLTAAFWSLNEKVIARVINVSLLVFERLFMFVSISVGVGQDT